MGMKPVGLPVAEGTAAGGFSVNGLTEALEAAESEVPVPEALVMVDEAALVTEEAAPVTLALEATPLTTEVAEMAEPSCAATSVKAGTSAASDVKAAKRILLKRS